jgi:hypothetical protein
MREAGYVRPIKSPPPWVAQLVHRGTRMSWSVAPKTSSGKRAVPYWSSRARAKRAAEIWAGGLRPVAVTLDAWRADELPELAAEDYLVGINWTGPRLVGWEFTVPEVLNRLSHVLHEGPYSDDTAAPPTA